MNRKIIFFDVDGTLYDAKLGIPDSTRTAIKMLRENGHIPIICTGRAKVMVPDSYMEIGFSGIVAGGGTYIMYQDKMIHHKVMGVEYIEDIVPLLQERKIRYIIEGPECIYYDNKDLSEAYGFVLELLKKLPENQVRPLGEEEIRMNKISCFLTDENDFNSIQSKIEEKFDLIRHQQMNVIELVPKGYNKASGIERLIHYLGIDRKDTYAFGDSTNDLEMLQYVEYGIAMGNSYPEVLQQAKFKTKPINEDGIYYGLKEFGLI